MPLAIIIAGFGGGMVRGLIGFIKHQYSYKNVGFTLNYFLAMPFLSGVIGILTAASGQSLGINFLGSGYGPAFAFVVGYAGGDFVENVFKIISKKSSLIDFEKEKEWSYDKSAFYAKRTRKNI